MEVKEISAEATYSIRKEVLRKHIPLPFEFTGDMDKDTVHLGAFSGNKLVAIASFMKSNNPKFEGLQYQLRGMATLESYRGAGAGKLMVKVIFLKLKEMKISCLWCNARIEAVDFYKKQGLQIQGLQFEIPYIGTHYLMFKKLK